MGKRKSKPAPRHTSMRLHDSVKLILIGHAKQAGWSEAKIANLLIELGDAALRGDAVKIKAAGHLLDAAGKAAKIKLQADTRLRDANAEVRKFAAKLRDKPPGEVTPEQMKGGAV